MQNFFADFHIHVGISNAGQWVKIPTSKRLTVATILETTRNRKGLDMIGIIDALSPWVQEDLEALLADGRIRLLPGGGYVYDGGTVLVTGAEVETSEPGGGSCHTLLYTPDLAGMRRLTETLRPHIRNIHLSSQNAHMSFRQLLDIVHSQEVLVVPAHIFTPYKSLYGACAKRLSDLLPEQECRRIAAMELGLSADTEMADRLRELWDFTFVSNSDAHSPDRIGREYNQLQLEQADFSEFAKALSRQAGRRVTANFGLDPRLGKYHRNACDDCGRVLEDIEAETPCPGCGSRKIVRGVAERISSIADMPADVHPAHRAAYRYHLPLSFLPGLGNRGLDKLLDVFGTELNVLHEAPLEDVARIAGKKVAQALSSVRDGSVTVQSGGGGLYGRIVPD